MKPLVRLMGCESDTVTSIDEGLRLARIFRAPVARLSNVGHVPHIEDPIHFLSALDAAIAEPVP